MKKLFTKGDIVCPNREYYGKQPARIGIVCNIWKAMSNMTVVVVFWPSQGEIVNHTIHDLDLL